MCLICIRCYRVGCGFPVLRVAGHTPEMAGFQTGYQGPQATKQRIMGRAGCPLRLLGKRFGACSWDMPGWGCQGHSC